MKIIINNNENLTRREMLELFRRKILKYIAEKNRILVACD